MLTLLLIALSFQSSAQFQQDDLDNIARNLKVHFDVINNFEAKGFKCRFLLTNAGSQQIERGPWEMYFNSIRMIEPSHLANNPDGYTLSKYGVKFAHVTGSLFKMQPVEGFQTVLPGNSSEIIFYGAHWLVSRTDVMPNFYVASSGLQAKNIASTSTLDFVGKFDTKEKWKRFESDHYDPFTPQKRFDKNSASKVSVGVSVIPTPVEMTVDHDQFVDIEGWTIITPKLFESEAKYLAEQLKLTVTIESGDMVRKKAIHFMENNVTVDGMNQYFSQKEAYVLNVSSIITIAAEESSGAFYAVQSLLSIIDQDRKKIPKVLMKDMPRFRYRGMMLDIARNFHDKTTILKLMDAMAMYKLNKLHLHLTDDEGWRLDIPGLDELAGLGSRRCHDVTCLAPQLGSGASADTSGTGFLTVRDYQDILKHGRKLHIEIIPEFDMPGHSHAAIRAMEHRYNNNNKSRNQTIRDNASQFLLTEPGDSSQYLSIQMFTHDAINPCLNSTYKFIEHLLSSLITIHKDIQPLSVFHMGGDEVAKGAWLNSTMCQKLISKNAKIGSVKDLKEYFFSRVAEIANKYDIDVAAWEDGLMRAGKPFELNKQLSNNVFSYAWNNVWEWGAFNRAYVLANAGYKNVMCQATHLYFDMPYEPDPEERGFYWATRYTDTRKTFGFMPDNLYRNAKLKLSGEATSQEILCKVDGACPPLTKPENIVGMQAQLWSETVRTSDQLFYMIFPRLLAMAERAWHKGEFEEETSKDMREMKEKNEWEVFVNILGNKELKRLDEMKISYRVSPPGAKIVGGKLVVKADIPGLKVEYRPEDAAVWQEYKQGDQVKGKLVLRAKSADGKRSSREIRMEIASGKSQILLPKPVLILLFVLFGLQTAF